MKRKPLIANGASQRCNNKAVKKLNPEFPNESLLELTFVFGDFGERRDVMSRR